MQQMIVPRPQPAPEHWLQAWAGEPAAALSAPRWLASLQLTLQSLESEAPLETARVVNLMADCLARRQAAQPSAWDAAGLRAVWKLFQEQTPKRWPAQALEALLRGLPVAEAVVLWPYVQELQALELRFEAWQRLEGKIPHVATDAMAAYRLFVGEDKRLPATLEDSLQAVLQGWSERLWMPDAESRHALCVLWARELAGRYQASEQEWRFCLACVEQALLRHLGAGLARVLQPAWSTLACATHRFALCLTACQHLPEVLQKVGQPPFEVSALVSSLLGEILYQTDSRLPSWPVMSALVAGQQPLGGMDAQGWREFRRAFLEGYRPHMERSWLDLLEEPCERIQRRLDLLAWRSQQRALLKDLYAGAAASLREVLQAFQKNPKAEQDLYGLLEGAWDCHLVGRSSTGADQLFRTWLSSYFLPLVGLDWQQPKAVVAALRTALGRLPADPRAGIEGVSARLSVYPGLATFLPEALKLESWLPPDELSCSCWWSLLAQGPDFASSWSRHWLRRWSAHPGMQARPSLEALLTACPLAAARPLLESAQTALRSAWLSHQLGSHADSLARQAAAWVYKEMEEYAQQTGGVRGLEKCARDNSFTLRRVALAWELEVEDPAGFVADWWTGLVGSYLATRPSRLFQVNLEGLLEATRETLEADERSQLEAVLRPIFEEAARHESAAASFQLQPVSWSLPLSQKAEHASTLPLGEDVQQAAYRHAGPFHKPVGPWKVLLQEGWRLYLGHGCLDPSFCRRWAAYCEENKASLGELHKFLRGLYLGQDNQGAQRGLPRVDFLQAMLDFTRQLELAQPISTRADELVAATLASLSRAEDPAWSAALGNWLRQVAGQSKQLAPPMLWWEADRGLLELASRAPQGFPWVDFLPGWSQALARALGPGAGAQATGWNRRGAHLPSALPELARLARLVTSDAEPLFSPSAAEEMQWRQLLLMLLVGSLRQHDQESRLVFWALAGSLKIVRDRAFAGRLGKLRALLRDRCPEVPELLYADSFQTMAEVAEAYRRALAVSGRLAGARDTWPADWKERPDLEAWILAWLRPSSGTAGRWDVPGLARLAWSADAAPTSWPSAPSWTGLASDLPAPAAPASPPAEIWLDSLDLDLGPGPHPFDVQRCQRDLRWLGRRMAWRAWRQSLGGPAGPTVADWYGREVLPYVGPADEEHRWQALFRLTQALAGQDGVLREAYDLLETLLCPDHEQGMWLYVPCPRDRRNVWFEGSSLRALPQAARLLELLARYGEDVVWLGMAPSALVVGLAGLGQASSLESVCESILEAVPQSGLSVDDQVRACQAVQCVQLVLRSLHLAESLGGETVARMLETAGLDSAWNDLLHFQVRVWRLCAPEQAWLATVGYLLRHPGLLDQADRLEALESAGQPHLDAICQRGWTLWCRQLRLIFEKPLGRGVPIFDSLHDPRCPLVYPIRRPAAEARLAKQLVALAVLKEARLPRLYDLRRAALLSWEGPVEGWDGWLSWLAETRIDVDLSAFRQQAQELRQGQAMQAARGRVRAQGPALVAVFRERFAGLLEGMPDEPWIELLEVLAEGAPGLPLAGPTSSPSPLGLQPWPLPRTLALPASQVLARLGGSSPDELARLQTALVNALCHDEQAAEELSLEISRLLDWCQRLSSFAATWEKARELSLGGQAAHPFWQFLVRRVALEGWLAGRPYHSGGVMAWIRFNLATGELEPGPRPFLKAVREVLTGARSQGDLPEGMARVAEETMRSLERRLDGSTAIWESLLQPSLEPGAAQKPYKRSLWGRISDSLGGMVSGR